MEIYFDKENILVNQDELYVYSNDSKLYSWSKKGEYGSLYFDDTNYMKITIFAVITSQGDFYYMLTSLKHGNKFAY